MPEEGGIVDNVSFAFVLPLASESASMCEGSVGIGVAVEGAYRLGQEGQQGAGVGVGVGVGVERAYKRGNKK